MARNSFQHKIYKALFPFLRRRNYILNISVLIFLSLPSILALNTHAKPIQSSTSNENKRLILANSDHSKKNLYLNSGNANRTISAWKEAASQYHNENRTDKEIETLLKIAKVHISLGQFYLAINELDKIIALDPSDPDFLALAKKRLGNAYSGIGEYDKAIFNYKSSLKKKESLSTINSLVEVLTSKEKYAQFIEDESRQINPLSNNKIAQHNISSNKTHKKVLKYASQALSKSNKTDLSSVRALINWEKIPEKNLSRRQLEKGRKILQNLPSSRSLAFTLLKWSKIDSDNKKLWLQIALDTAKSLKDNHLLSYVFLEWGYYDEDIGDLTQALNHAQKSQLLAQSEFAYDSLFRAQQLTAKIYKQQGNTQGAITAYKNSISSFDTLSRNSLTIDSDRRTNFKSEVEPIYRETLKLLLNQPKIEKENLVEAINIFDKLRLAQLQNYFGDDCFEIREANSLDQQPALSDESALINSIILEDEVFFILQLPNGEIHYDRSEMRKTEISKLAKEWHKELNDRATWKFRTNSRKLYDLIIKPFESKLEANNLDVLIFVHDGVLRNLPMSALSDGEKFLAQKWASVSSIGLDFVPAPTKKNKAKAIAFGLKAQVPGWRPLSSVASEIQDVQNIIGGDKFIDSEFTVDNLYNRLSENNYSVIHLASHGYFGGTAETSFILGYDRKH